MPQIHKSIVSYIFNFRRFLVLGRRNKPQTMRKYIVYYYAEINDECVELEHELEELDMTLALATFRSEIKVFKRVYKIEEKIK
jgi:hypothetical protein